jgi:transcriptional/translational regulatory protein YebC/TACO1
LQYDDVFLAASEGGAADVEATPRQGGWTVWCEPAASADVRAALAAARIPFVVGSRLALRAPNPIVLEGRDLEVMLTVLEKLELADEVDHVYPNFVVPEEDGEAAAGDD